MSTLRPKGRGSACPRGSTLAGRGREERLMPSKTKATQKASPKKEEVKEEPAAAGAAEKEAAESPDTPLPLLDLSDAAVKKLIRQAKKRGYVTHDEINAVLPSEEV